MTNINKFGVGKLKSAKLKDGRIVERPDLLMVKLGEQILMVPQVNDDDHFIYQAHKLYTEAEVITKFGGVLPDMYCGPATMCTCGSSAVTLTEGPYANHEICKHFVLFGKHQTSEKIEEGKLILSKDSKKWLDDSANIDFTKIEKATRKF